jgi:hypothetical protein
MKFVACIIIMLDTLYMTFSAYCDDFLNKKVPSLYKNLDLIGLKETEEWKKIHKGSSI